jgi:hypothetical protein
MRTNIQRGDAPPRMRNMQNMRDSTAFLENIPMDRRRAEAQRRSLFNSKDVFKTVALLRVSASLRWRSVS